MTTNINNFLSTPIDGLIKYLLTDSDNDPVFNELSTLPEKSKNTPSKDLKRKTVDSLNQPIVKKTHIETNTSSLQNNLKTYPEWKKEELVESINQTHEKAKTYCLEKIQMHFANQFNIGIQGIKKIYLAVSTHCPTADEPSIINTKIPLVRNKLEMNPMFKRTLVDSINRLFHITNRSLEEIQMDFANQFGIDIQEIKKIYLAVSTHCPTVDELSLIDTKALSVKNNIIISPELKKKMVYDINQIFDRLKIISLEKIQTHYASQLKLDLQEVKNISSLSSHKLK